VQSPSTPPSGPIELPSEGYAHLVVSWPRPIWLGLLLSDARNIWIDGPPLWTVILHAKAQFAAATMSSAAEQNVRPAPSGFKAVRGNLAPSCSRRNA
jgi:hypothetical protein